MEATRSVDSTSPVSEKVRALSFKHGEYTKDRVPVVLEKPLTIKLNGNRIVTLLCIDDAPRFLAVGFLVNEGLIRDPAKIKEVVVASDGGSVDVISSESRPAPSERVQAEPIITTGCGKGTTFHHAVDEVFSSPAGDGPAIDSDKIFDLMRELTDHSTIYKETRGTHNCALCDKSKLLVFHFDVGRHNAVDKICGQCALEGISLHDKILLTTGRITSEIVLKIGRMRIPVLISRHAATNLASELGRKYRKTLVGLVRGRKFVVYSGFHRISDFTGEPR